MRDGAGVERFAGKDKLSHASIQLLTIRVRVLRDDGALRPQLEIEPGAETVQRVWVGKRLGEDDLVQIACVERLCIHNSVALITAAHEVEEVGGLLRDGTIHIRIELHRVIRRLRLNEWVFGIQTGIIAEDQQVTMHLARAGLR